MTITSLASGETVEMQYNPAELEETLEAVYARLQPPGLPHEIMQYGGTKNLGVTFDLAFDALANPRDYDADDALAARRFLQSFLYPARGASTVRGGSPSRALFIWPQLYTLTTKITKVRIRFTRFALSGKPTAFVATLNIEEIRDMRLTAEEIMADGTQRADSGGTLGREG